MPYKGPKLNPSLSEEDRQAILKDYFSYYRQMWKEDPSVLNRKLPPEARKAFEKMLGEIGGVLLSARELANQPGPIRKFWTTTGCLGNSQSTCRTTIGCSALP